MTYADAIAIVGGLFAVAFMFVGVVWAAGKNPPSPPRREEPMRWEYTRTTYRYPNTLRWKTTRHPLTNPDGAPKRPAKKDADDE